MENNIGYYIFWFIVSVVILWGINFYMQKVLRLLYDINTNFRKLHCDLKRINKHLENNIDKDL
jgi:hypothetical protein